MPSMLGKRKTRPAEEKPEKEEQEEDTAAAAARELLRKHFEARFKPVAVAAPASCASKSKNKSNADSGDEDEDESYDDDSYDEDTISDDDEWGGLSGDEDDDDDEDTPKVEVVDHTSSSQPVNIATMSKKELKAYLSSRPPTTGDTAQPTTTQTKPKNPTEEDSAAFLANDLALQRLIAESHILSAAGGNSSHYLSSHAEQNAIANNKTFVEGRTRLKTTDMRIQALGAKTSILSQAKMPMGMRKGISQAAVSKEEKRRREARENGIILERKAGKKSGGGGGGGGGVKKRRSERPVDMPGVGKMRGSELRISARDVRSIEGVRSSGGGREKKSRGRRR